MDYESALLLSYKTYLEYLEHTIKGQGLFVGGLSFLCSDISPRTRRALWVLLCSPLYCSSLYLTPSLPHTHAVPYALHDHTFIQITMPYALYCHTMLYALYFHTVPYALYCHTFIQCHMPFTAIHSYNAICPLLLYIHTVPYALYCHTFTMPLTAIPSSYNAICPSLPYLHTVPYALHCQVPYIHTMPHAKQ